MVIPSGYPFLDKIMLDDAQTISCWRNFVGEITREYEASGRGPLNWLVSPYKVVECNVRL